MIELSAITEDNYIERSISSQTGAGAGEEVADTWYTRDFSATWQDVTEGCSGLIDKTIQQGCRR